MEKIYPFGIILAMDFDKGFVCSRGEQIYLGRLSLLDVEDRLSAFRSGQKLEL
jgi:hypothetical protein